MKTAPPETAQALREHEWEDWEGFADHFSRDEQAGSGGNLLSPILLYLKSLPRAHPTVASTDHKIVRPPGSLLSGVAELLFSPKTLERVVRPIISDLQMEYCEALAAGRRYKAEWVRLRGYWSFFKVIGLYSIVKMVAEMWRKVSL